MLVLFNKKGEGVGGSFSVVAVRLAFNFECKVLYQIIVLMRYRGI